MKKTFILAFFMAFCSMVFGQNWGNVNMAFPENMTVTSKVFIDGTELNGTNYVLGAFCGDELRGSAKLQYFAPEDDYLAMVLVYGNGVTDEHPADQIKFKLYDINTDKVYSISNDEALPLVNDKMNGSLTPYAPYEINFLGNPAARISETYYATLQEAVGKAENGETVTLLTSISLAETIKITKNIVLDLNGKTIAGTDNATASFALIEVQPDKELTVEGNNGTITLTATNNRQFNAFSSVISNQRGKLVVNNATIEHLGGTDMAYAIDNLTNTGAQIAETVINSGTIKSPYRAIRQFLNSSAQGVNNILTVNGGTIEGANKSIWMQDANAKANPGKLTVSENASLKGDVYLTVTAGSTEWPVEVMVKAAALKEGAEVLANNNVPAKYEVKLVDDYYTVVEIDPVAEINGTIYYTLQSAFAAATEGQTVVMLRDVTEDFAINKADINVTFEMGTNTLTGAILPSKANLTVKNGTIVNNNTDYSAIEITSGSIVLNDDVKVSSVRHAIRIDGAVEATIKGGEYTLIPKPGRTHHALYVSGLANVTIEGGKFVGPKETASDSGSAVNVKSGATVAISGGEFSGGKLNTLASSGTLSLTGGRYDQDVQKYCAVGYIAVKDGDWYEVIEAVAKIDEKYYATLPAAVEAAQAGETVVLIKTTTGAGVVIDKDITIDFNGKTYTFNKTVGSTGTTTLGLQILKDNNVTLKNGTLTSTVVVEGKEVKMLVQNYANLTLTDMNLVDNTAHILYALSNNSGTVNINGATNITTDKVAFDVCKYASYAAPTVNVETTGIIKGAIEVTAEINNNLNISGGLFTAQIQEAWCAEGYIPTTTTVDGVTYYTVKEGKYVAQIGTTKYETFAAALAAVQDGEIIELFDVEGNENTEINFDRKIAFTIKGYAPKYALPVVTFTNAKVNIEGSTILIPELDARKDATINVISSTVYDAGGNSIVKSYYNGAINIDENSTVYTMQVTTMGYITVKGTLNATWQTNVYGNGLITLNDGAKFNTAALQLTGQDYNGRDNTDANRVGEPAEIIVIGGAKFVVGSVKSSSGADYSYNSSKGINIGTVAGKSAILTLNGGNVDIYMADGQNVNIGALGTVEVGASTMKTICRSENGTVGIINNGKINFSKLTAELHTAQAGLNVTTTVDGYAVKYDDDDDVYKLVANMVVNTNTNVTYPSLAEAIANATAGNKLQFLTDINENVTINKSLTIDGANFNYTGTMSANNDITVTVQYVNFVNAGFDKSTKSTNGNYNFNYCTFDGQGTYAYSITAKGANKININNCTVKNYVYGFLYVRTAVNTGVKVKDVLVENCPNYAVYFGSGAGASTVLENMTVKNSNAGVIYHNQTSARTFTMKNCTMEGVAVAVDGTGGTNTITCKLEDNGNNFGGATLGQTAEVTLINKDVTLAAVEGLNVNITSELEDKGYMVEYSDGTYYVAEGLVGSGTKEDPFIIDNLHKLIIFRDHVNAGKTKYNAEGVHVALAANIDMATEDWSNNIGDDCNYTFDGIFDGKGYILSNLNSVEKAQKTDGYICTGLFGAIAGNAVVKNFTIENVNITTASYTGNNVAAVVGFIYNGNPTIEGVTVKNATINASAAYAVGTIAGYSFEAGVPSIKNCVVEGAEINAASGSGAIVGHCAGRATIEDNTVKDIEITAKGLVGGIAGLVDSKNSVLNNNTVVNVTLETTGEFWANSAAIAVGTMVNDGLTVAGTTFENVNVDRMVGSVYAYIPQTEVPAVQARIADKYYGTLQAAIDAAVTGDEIVLLADINLNNTELGLLDNAFSTYFKVEGKTITIDLNGKKISGTFNAEPMLVGVFSTDNNGHLTLVDNSTEQDALVDLTSGNNQVYALIANYEAGSTITINGGTYNLDKAIDSHMYTGGDEGIVVNGGNFTLGNVGEGQNGKPWIFNALGGNVNNVVVNGGTFNADINHQFWANEVYVPETKALQKIGEKTWTVVEAVAYAEEQATSTGATVRKVGYASLADAVKSTGETVTVIKEHVTTTPAIVEKNMTIDFANLEITGDVYPVVRIQNNATVTVKNGNITNGDYIFTLGSSDQTTAGNLTIEDGTYVGETTAANVVKGLLTINGGDFSISEDTEYNYAYVINCYDDNYKNGTAKVSISGGTFRNFNPEDNKAEQGGHTNFCAAGYGAVETATGSNIWTVVPKQGQTLTAGWNWFSSYINISGEEGLATLENALGQNGVMIKRNGGYVEFYNSDNDAYDMWIGTNFDAVSVKEMYMINTNADTRIQLRGDIVDYADTKITINQGWNWIGYPVTEAVNINVALKQVQAQRGDKIVGRKGTMEYLEGAGWVAGNLNSLEPGQGYMYYKASGESFEFTYNVTATREEVKANITADNNYWVPNSAEFANIMTMTAVLNIDGNEMNEDFEVAAFANGEVRGSARPIYIEAIDRYMVFMNIYGEGNEELTFKCYDIYSDEEYTLSNNLVYSDFAMIGSASEPYMLTLNTMGMEENAASALSIYPNPTTTNAAISFDTVYDMVEVFNALGAKVAEYSNVDRIEGMEAAGVYVIRVTNDNAVQNCRLIVK